MCVCVYTHAHTTRSRERPAINPVWAKKGEKHATLQSSEWKEQERGRRIQNNHIGFMLLCRDNDLTCLLERSDPATLCSAYCPQGGVQDKCWFWKQTRTHTHTKHPRKQLEQVFNWKLFTVIIQRGFKHHVKECRRKQHFRAHPHLNTHTADHFMENRTQGWSDRQTKTTAILGQCFFTARLKAMWEMNCRSQEEKKTTILCPLSHRWQLHVFSFII